MSFLQMQSVIRGKKITEIDERMSVLHFQFLFCWYNYRFQTKSNSPALYNNFFAAKSFINDHKYN